MTNRKKEPKSPALPFTPVPVRPRHDGWTPKRQIAFVQALAECLCVDQAARHVGMTARSARDLRLHPRSRAFCDAWDAALDVTILQVEEGAVLRSVRGVARPIFYKGEQVGEWRHHDERMTMFLLRYRRPARFGPWLDHVLPPPAPRLPGWDLDPALDETAERLTAECEEIEEFGPLEWEEDPDQPPDALPEPGPDAKPDPDAQPDPDA